MKKCPYPCRSCTQGICDYRRCSAYHNWLNDSWKRFQHHLPRAYWRRSSDEEKLLYIHPDVFRRYLSRGPCGLCDGGDGCEIPCKDYWRWWDARMIWLKWKLQNMEQ